MPRPESGRRRAQVSMDLLLVLMVVIWGANYSVIKRCFAEIPPQPFNALRLLLASTVYLVAIRVARGRARRAGAVSSIFYTPEAVTRADWRSLAALGFIGHFCYQWCFVAGVNATTASNAALIIGATPAVVAVSAALLGRDRITPFHWIGAAISAVGIYLVVGRDASHQGPTLGGDLLIMVSVGCWAAYTLGSARLMARHSPLYVTGTTMAIGGLPYAALQMPQVWRVSWGTVSAWSLAALVLSALLALCLAYLIWYAGVQRLGPARTSIFSNVVPIVAMAVATLWLGEPLTPMKMGGAAAVIGGVLLTRIGRPAVAVPVEE